MKLTSGLICMLALFFLLACNNGGEKANVSPQGSLTAEEEENLLLFKELFSSKGGYPLGDSVTKGDLDSCRRVYDSVMLSRGIGEKENLPVDIRITNTLKISQYVNFSDSVLLKWLATKTKALKAGAPENSKDSVGILIFFGMYNGHYIERKKLDPKLLYRTTVFIVPTLGKFNEARMLEDSRPAYNLGGVAP